MIREDFDAVALRLNMRWHSSGGDKYVVVQIAHDLADYFEATYPHFSRLRFIERVIS
jgi:hypothetical protein